MSGTATAPPDWRRSGVWREWRAPNGWIRGWRHYQPALRAAAYAGAPRPRGYVVPVEVNLVREPRSEYDGWALRAEIKGRRCGHLAREVAGNVAPELDRLGLCVLGCCGLVHGGFTPESGGPGDFRLYVWLDRCRTPQPPMPIDDFSDGAMPWPLAPDEG